MGILENLFSGGGEVRWQKGTKSERTARLFSFSCRRIMSKFFRETSGARETGVATYSLFVISELRDKKKEMPVGVLYGEKIRFIFSFNKSSSNISPECSLEDLVRILLLSLKGASRS